MTEIAWLGLFALSLDLILGYAGIISLGHAAFFGFGAYAAACSRNTSSSTSRCWRLLLAGGAAAALGFATSFLVLRGSDLTRLMVTLGVALVLRELANRYGWLTGGADGLQGVTIAADPGPLPLRYVRPQRLRLLPGGAVHLVPDRARGW